MSKLFAGVVPFVHTARSSSFRKAAERLGVTPAAVSKSVRALEEELGVELLRRTTRKVTLSDEGAAFLVRCEAAIEQVEAGRASVKAAHLGPRGPLRLSVPHVLGQAIVSRLEPFATRYPSIRLDLSFSDRKVRLVEEGVDVALRVEPLADSALRSRKLAQMRWVTVAAPAYLARHGSPVTVAELAHHTCLRFKAPRGTPVRWSYRNAAFLAVDKTIDFDRGELVLEAALAGLGVAQVFEFMARPHLTAARLVELLPDQDAPGPAVHAVFSPARQLPLRARVMLDFLEDLFREPAWP